VGAFALPGGWRANYVRHVSVRLKLRSADPRLVPNLTASADLILDSGDDCTLVPRECVFQEAGSSFVFVKADDSWQRRPVELGLSNNTVVAVTSGLQEGEEVAAEVPGS